MRNINFLGLNISTGQQKRGPEKASDFVRPYFSMLKTIGLNFIDYGSVDQKKESFTKMFHDKDLSLFTWNPYKIAYLKISHLLRQSEPLVNWGGDHSVALSTVGSFCDQYPNGFVLWIDAHADLNLPKFSLTGSLHGMPLSILLNLENIAKNHFPWITSHLNHRQLIYLGIRDIDPFEQDVIDQLQIKSYSAEDVRKKGMVTIAEQILKLTKGRPVHISFDIDSVSPEFAKATGVLVPNGLTPDDINLLAQTLSHHSQIKSIDVVEINPLLGDAGSNHETTVVALNFLKNLLCLKKLKIKPGGPYDDVISRTNKEQDTTQLEPSLSV